jgi:hypothetical protein
MNRILQLGSVLLLAVGVGYGSDQQTNQPAQPPADTPAKPVVPAKKNGGVPKPDPIPKGGASLPVPPADYSANNT